jgi:hypothetical protein
MWLQFPRKLLKLDRIQNTSEAKAKAIGSKSYVARGLDKGIPTHSKRAFETHNLSLQCIDSIASWRSKKKFTKPLGQSPWEYHRRIISIKYEESKRKVSFDEKGESSP